MTIGIDATTSQWRQLDPGLARGLVDARLQLHHAAQLATAIGISYLPKKADDSHTSLEWLPRLSGLASRLVPTSTPFRVAVAVSPLALLLLDSCNDIIASFALHGRTMNDAYRWLSAEMSGVRADPGKLTLNRHYTIPSHALDDGAAFDASDTRAFEELGRWYADAALLLSELAASTPGASEVRCWPHHFDIATLIEVEPARGSDWPHTVGVGLEPGDNYYAEPYVYANMYPSPSQSPVAALEGGGVWHTHEWVGAVLPGSRLGATDQRAQLEAFIHSAVRACSEVVKRR